MTKGSDIAHRIKWKLRTLLYRSPEMRLASIPTKALLCDDVVYRGQDFAGAPIERFPMVDLYRLYDKNRNSAFEKFHHWMGDWLILRQGWKIPKRKGGMANGSLYTLVCELHQEKLKRPLDDFSQSDKELVDEAIAMRARHYFIDVYESIKTRGYDDSMAPPITCVRRGDAYMIKNGHHRAAALLVLGYEMVKVMPI